MDMLREDGRELRFEEPLLKDGYKNEVDALRLLSDIEHRYEPVRLFGRR